MWNVWSKSDNGKFVLDFADVPIKSKLSFMYSEHEFLGLVAQSFMEDHCSLAS